MHKIKLLAIVSLLASLTQPVCPKAQTVHPTQILMECSDVAPPLEKLTFHVLTTDGSGAIPQSGTASASYWQNSTGGPQWMFPACGNGLKSYGGTSCEFEANHAPGDYYFTASFSGYTAPDGTVFAPSSEQHSCVFAY